MAASASEDDSGERSPLLLSEASDVDVKYKSLLHRDSVYSFVVFMPPLSRRAHGHYITVPVMLAFLLFVLTVTCQLALTLIAGGYIQNNSRDFKVSLIRHETMMVTAITPIDWVRETTMAGIRNIGRGWAPDVVSEECCLASECSSILRCCSPSEKKRLRAERAEKAKKVPGEAVASGSVGRNSTSFLFRHGTWPEQQQRTQT